MEAIILIIILSDFQTIMSIPKRMHKPAFYDLKLKFFILNTFDSAFLIHAFSLRSGNFDISPALEKGIKVGLGTG